MGVDDLFTRFGWQVVDNIPDADLVQFTGGADINPAIYNQAKHNLTFYSNERDGWELTAFKVAQKQKKPMAGICRGAQLLCALFGGELWQHVDGHQSGAHQMTDTATGEKLMTTSAHHQMMIPSNDGKIIAIADESKRRTKMGRPGTTAEITDYRNFRSDPDIEAVWWPERAAFGIQGHPEWAMGGLGKWYFKQLDNLLGFKTPALA